MYHFYRPEAFCNRLMWGLVLVSTLVLVAAVTGEERAATKVQIRLCVAQGFTNSIKSPARIRHLVFLQYSRILFPKEQEGILKAKVLGE